MPETPSHAFTGNFLRVLRQQRRLPNGHNATIEWVDHPGAVLIVPVLSSDRIVLLRQYRPVIDEMLYELPAGTREPEEAPENCAARELIEETGYQAGSLERLGTIYPCPGYSTEQIIIYRATDLSEKPGQCEPDEIIETETVSRRRMRELFSSGAINDSKTICALAMCGWLS